MPINPDQAWQGALGQLQREMPRTSFDTWVRDTCLVNYDDGQFSIGVRNAYTRDWLESRLTSTATRLLMGIMNREVSISFVVDDHLKADDDDQDDDRNDDEHKGDNGQAEPQDELAQDCPPCAAVSAAHSSLAGQPIIRDATVTVLAPGGVVGTTVRIRVTAYIPMIVPGGATFGLGPLTTVSADSTFRQEGWKP